MTTQNWPDPTRPGVPMFPEQDGWHMLDRDVWQWSAKRKAWNDTVLHPNFVLPKNMAWRKYHGPVLTPTQINEMLAAERERCAIVCENQKPSEDNASRSICLNSRWHTASQCAANIRNLGAAP